MGMGERRGSLTSGFKAKGAPAILMRSPRPASLTLGTRAGRGLGLGGPFTTLLPCGLGPSPRLGASVSPYPEQGAHSGMALPASQSCTLWLPGSCTGPWSRTGAERPSTSAGGSHGPCRAGGRAPLGARGRGLPRTGSDEATPMAAIWPSKQALNARTRSAAWRGVYMACGLRGGGAAGGVEGACGGPGAGRGLDPLKRDGHAGRSCLPRGRGGVSRTLLSMGRDRGLRCRVTERGRGGGQPGGGSPPCPRENQHWPPEARPWARPWGVGQPGQLPRARSQGGGRGPGVQDGRGQQPPRLCDRELGGRGLNGGRGSWRRRPFSWPPRGCRSQHQCRPCLWFCALHADETTERRLFWAPASAGISSPGSCASRGS